MNKLESFAVKYNSPRNRKLLYIAISLIALAIAGGAPGAGSGIGGGFH